MLKTKKYNKLHHIAYHLVIYALSFYGLTFFGLYYGRFLVPRIITAVLIMINWVSVVFIFESLDGIFLNRTFILESNSRKKHSILKIALIGLLFGLLLETFGMIFTRLWYYPHGNIGLYFLLTPIAHPLYFFFLYQVYDFFHRKFFNSTTPLTVHPQSRFYKNLIRTLAVLGFLGIFIALIKCLIIIQSVNVPLFAININYRVLIDWWLPFLASFSLFFLSEYACFTENKPTLIFDLLNGRGSVLFAIILASLVGILFIEFANAPLGLWVFDNWAFNDIRIANIPLLAYLVWPTQFLIFLSFLRLVFRPRTLKIW